MSAIEEVYSEWVRDRETDRQTGRERGRESKIRECLSAIDEVYSVRA